MDQYLKDKKGVIICRIVTRGDKQFIYDRHGNQLGYFDGKHTYNKNGKMIAQGNMLTSLLPNK